MVTKEQARKALRRSMKAMGAEDRDAAVERIAREVLGVESLVERGRDALDFKELAVWTVGDALRAAYEAGRRAGERG